MAMSMCSSTLSPKTKILKPAFRSLNRPIMRFREGDSVEVSSNEEGFFGSYWEAKIVAKIASRNEYVVEYKTLLEEDLSGPLREVVSGSDVRPRQPAGSSTRHFAYGDRVDAFDNDGWWVGTVRGANEDEGRYYVFFEYFNVGITYDVSRIRVHQEWKNGVWSTGSRWRI